MTGHVSPAGGSLRKIIATVVCWWFAAPFGWAQDQQQEIAPVRPRAPIFVRPYSAPTIPPAPLSNSPRLHDLIRAGKLYLTAQDAIILALENNIDVELARYQPILDQWNLERAEAGGPLPGVPNGSSQSTSVASGEGVAGSQAAAGVSSSGGGRSSGNAVNATITQIGPVTPTLDPTFQDTQSYSHLSSPQAILTQSQTFNLIQNKRNYTESFSEGFITGGKGTLTYSDSYLNENAPTDLLNPENGTVLSISLQHNLLQGFGVALNSRNITVAKANLRLDDLNFKGEVISSVANVLNLYYGLVADYEDLKAKQSALDVAKRFYENNKKQVELGTMAPLDVTTAEAQVASSEEDLVTSQTTLQEQEISLKNVLSRIGLGDPLLKEVQIIPLDRIEVPEQDHLPPLQQLIATAWKNRTDLAANKINLSNSEISALGTKNNILPALVGLATVQAQGLSGSPKLVVFPPRSVAQQSQGNQNQSSGNGSVLPGFVPCPAGAPSGSTCLIPDSYFVGGIGTALGQMVRRDFPSESGGGYFAPTIHNRQAQADYAIDQLSLKQTELENQRSVNQAAVDVSNQVVGLQQARVRYSAAVKNRVLQQQLLDAEQKRFSLGASTTFLVVQQQRDLATAQSSEVAALVAYSNARVALDQTLGTTLEVNHVSVEEARRGHVEKPSTLPATLPTQP